MMQRMLWRHQGHGPPGRVVSVVSEDAQSDLGIATTLLHPSLSALTPNIEYRSVGSAVTIKLRSA